MILLIILVLVLLLFLAVNWRVRKSNAYMNFYRAIHVVKDVEPRKRYRIAAFGSTFSYYAYDLKSYEGHNFSIEPQSITYMAKTVNHFVDNVEPGGIALISLAGCIFATSSSVTDEQCITYQSFLSPREFDNYHGKVKLKYYLKRYFPALSPYYLKCIVKDEPLKYELSGGISYEDGLRQAKARVAGWQRVVGQTLTEDFKINEDLAHRAKENVMRMQKIVGQLRAHDVTPVFVILPMSKAFNEVCPAAFYDEVLYRSLEMLKQENVLTLDFLKDIEMSAMKYYLCSDCLNAEGRKRFTQKVMEQIDFILSNDAETERNKW